MQTTDSLANSSNEVISTAITKLIDAAAASLDADPDNARRYLMRASALLCVGRGTHGTESTNQSESRGGLLSWQLNRVIDHIEKHLTDKITVTDLAGLLKMSMGRLFRAFKISVGVTPIQYIAKRRVELACTMMRTTREPLSQIAVGCGLCDQAHLCKVFRRIVGTTPSAWRRAALDQVDTGVFVASKVSRHSADTSYPASQQL
jgi:transcriptional regulator GlxA family with amidase domain